MLKKRIIAASLALLGTAFMAGNANAWHGHHFFGHHFYRPYYGGYYGGFYGSYYSYRPLCFPRYSYYWSCPTYYYYSPPIYYTPVCYTPVVSYQVSTPIVVNTWASTSVPAAPLGSASTSSIINNTQFASASRFTSPTNSGPLRTPASIVANLPSRVNGTAVEAAGPGKFVNIDSAPHPKANMDATEIRTLKPYSPVWSRSAVGLIDAMVAEGDLETANASCTRMESIKSEKDASVYLRTAVLAVASSSSKLDSKIIDHALDNLNHATAAGSELNAEELPTSALSSYLQSANVDMTAILDQLSKRVLDRPQGSGRELLLLSALLKLDGQVERAKLFAEEARVQAAQLDSFPWHALLHSLQPTTLVAAK